METASALVTPRLAEERGVLAERGHNILDRSLELEGAVGCVKRFGVVQVDFILGWAELGVAGEHPDVHLVEGALQGQEVALGVGLHARGVDHAGLGVSPLEATFFGALGDVELELGANHGLKA